MFYYVALRSTTLLLRSTFVDWYLEVSKTRMKDPVDPVKGERVFVFEYALSLIKT